MSALSPVLEESTRTGAADPIGATGASEPSPAPDPRVALARAVRHLSSLQRADGAWEGEMVWCSMITAQVVIVRRICGLPVDDATRAGIVRQLEATRTPEGGWGLHPESGPYVFFTTLAYTALRLLGKSADDPLCARARAWLHAQPGGVLAVPTWGKVWLSIAGLYGWEGVNPVPPEIFLLPRALPVHPHNFYCHTRAIYTAIAYLYGARFQADLGPLRDALRAELYPGLRYEEIDFAAHRHAIAASDLFVEPHALLRKAEDALRVYERWAPRFVRRAALEECARRVVLEQQTTRHMGISPVNGLLDCLVLHARGEAAEVARGLEGVEAWRWEDAAEGVRYVGARSHSWDTAFAIEALVEARRANPDESRATDEALRRAHERLVSYQLLMEVEPREALSRDTAVGGWCFSDGAHRWPVSDCTAEALSALLAAEALPGVIAPVRRIVDERVRLAVEFILSRRNADGGFATYERRRGSALLEAVNPSEMFGQCMTETSYIECTGSALKALAAARKLGAERLGARLLARIERAIGDGKAFLLAAQRPDGSWPGFWGVNFTYAAFHAARGLRAAGVPASDPALGRAANWLIRTQRRDGGWGEHHSGCLTQTYVEHERSQAVQTAWAVLALLDLRGPRDPAVARAVEHLAARQSADGAYPKESVNGVFFGAAMLDYRLYKSYFPTWALARRAALLELASSAEARA